MNSFTEGRYQFVTSAFAEVPDCLEEASIAFVGAGVDDRGFATVAALKERVPKVVSLSFEANQQQVFVDGKETNRSGMAALVGNQTKVLIDATTLGLGEILKLLVAIGNAGLESVDFLYAEPKQYTRKWGRESELVGSYLRDFDLTSNCRFVSILGFAHEYQAGDTATHVFFLGFEPARIQNALEQRGDIDPEKYRRHLVIGVPAFQAGWEADSIKPHLQVFEEQDITERSIHYCEADSIRESYLLLWDLYHQLRDDRSVFFISPLGTKPHSVGAALFLLETKGSECPTSLYYDHPVRVEKRSSDISAWHVTQARFK